MFAQEQFAVITVCGVALLRFCTTVTSLSSKATAIAFVKAKSKRPPGGKEEMTSPDSDAGTYVAAIIAWYLELPETRMSATFQDHRHARRWHEQSVPLHLAESALLLASLRLVRQPTCHPYHPSLRSLTSSPSSTNSGATPMPAPTWTTCA